MVLLLLVLHLKTTSGRGEIFFFDQPRSIYDIFLKHFVALVRTKPKGHASLQIPLRLLVLGMNRSFNDFVELLRGPFYIGESVEGPIILVGWNY